MRARLLTALGALSLPLVAPRPLPAQQPPLASCSYDACALRVEPRFLGLALVRGTAGESVARLGLFGPNLERIVQDADSAVRHARQYRRSQNRGGAAALAGTALTVAAVVQCRDEGFYIVPDCSRTALSMFIGGAALSLYGGFELARANRALSRAVWWYNRALPR